MSGVTRQSYAPEIRIIRLMCTGRVDLAFVLRALCNGADGVIIGGCWPGECHYVTEGNYDALANVHLAKKLLDLLGVRPERVRLEWIAASEGTRFAEAMSEFTETLHELGPLGEGDGIDGPRLRLGLGAAARLVPFLKLVEREKLRLPRKSERAYNEYFGSDDFDRLFRGLIADKLAVAQILTLLEERPRSTREISAALDMDPPIVSKFLDSSSCRGLVSYDVEQKSYALA